MNSLLMQLLKRGDKIALVNGRLLLESASGRPIPNDWLRANKPTLIAEIAQLTNQQILQYTGYTTGHFGEHKVGGLRLGYVDVVSRARCSAFFNVQLTRKRTTRHGFKGTGLPKGQFWVTENFAFYDFWLLLGISLPSRGLTAWHDKMGALKDIYIVGSTNERGKIENASIRPCQVTYNELLKLANVRRPNSNPGEIASYLPARSQQINPSKISDNAPTTGSDNICHFPQEFIGLPQADRMGEKSRFK